MFDIRLPTPIYERLPYIYLALAALLAIAPLGALKWALIIALLLATWMIKQRRRTYREAEKFETATRLMEKHGTGQL